MLFKSRDRQPALTPDIFRRPRQYGFRQKLGAFALGVAALFTAETAVAYITDPPDAPSVHVLDPDIIRSENPQDTARFRADNPEIVDQCKAAEFYTIDFSGTAMEISHYSASLKKPLVESMGGCALYFWYGHEYDPERSAQVIADYIDELTPDGERRDVIFFGTSFGGIAAEDIASQPAIRESEAIDLKAIMMEATPVDMQDVTEQIVGLPASVARDLPEYPIFGRILPGISNLIGQFERNDVHSWRAFYDTYLNTIKVRPPLARGQIYKIKEGMVSYRNDVPLYYFASPDSDNVVNVAQASSRMAEMVSDAPVRIFDITGMGHAGSWLHFLYPLLEEDLKESIVEARSRE